MKFKKSQSSLEFLIIFGIAFTLILILSAIFISYSAESKKELDRSQISQIGTQLMINVEKIYFLGDGNKITMVTNFPDNINNLSIHHSQNPDTGENFDYLVFSLGVENNSDDHVFMPNDLYIRFNCTDCRHDYTSNVSYYNDTSMFSGGKKRIKLESVGDYVNIGFVR